MSRGSGRAQDAQANATPEASEELDAATDPAAEPDEQQDEVTAMVEADPYDKLDGMSVKEAVASPMGAPDDYPYRDKTSAPVHERDMPVSTDAGGPSQAELNPAFYPKPEDGGPTVTNPETGEEEGIGTEPNVHDQMLASAQTAEENGQEGAVEQTQAQIDAGIEQQMDAQAVADAATAPAGIDSSTGQPEGQATPPGAPSGMEPDSLTGEKDVPTAGAEGDSSDSDKDNLKTPGADNS